MLTEGEDKSKYADASEDAMIATEESEGKAKGPFKSKEDKKDEDEGYEDDW
jgi:hypothetical protein